MKKIAIMGSGNGSNFETIARYFNGQDVEITCLCNVENAYILTRAKNLEIENKFLPYNENLDYFKENKFDLVVLAGYMRIIPDDVLKEMGKIINIHPSLLPAFKGTTNAIQEAFMAGVKVSGITIHWVTNDIDGGKIIAQYPVFIQNDMHFDEFEEAIHTIEHKLYPVVIEKILQDGVFEFQDLVTKKQSQGGCQGGCGGCKH